MSVEKLKIIFDGISKEYKDVLLHEKTKPLFIECFKKIENIKDITPTVDRILYAFKTTPYNNLTAIILGQDPYPTPGNAQGLSFSTYPVNPIPKSLINIHKCLLHHKLINEVPKNGNLEGWSKQGVLLLNMYLTTELGKSEAHPFWSKYTTEVIKLLLEKNPKIVLMLWGKKAQEILNAIPQEKYNILTWGHPSPLSSFNASGNPKSFEYCDNFIKTNEILTKNNNKPINWSSMDIDYDCEDDNSHDNLPTTYKKLIIQQENTNKNTENTEKNTQDTNRIDKKIVIATDGSSYANGKSTCLASWGYVISAMPDNLKELKELNDDTIEPLLIHRASGCVDKKTVDGEEIYPSNNRGEYLAMYYGLLYFYENYEKIKMPAVILSDSEYCIKTLTIWYDSWVKNNKLADKKNLDLIRDINNLREKIKAKNVNISFMHINSHENRPTDPTDIFYWHLNNIADRLCQSKTKEQKLAKGIKK